jgi:hypothetical protein
MQVFQDPSWLTLNEELQSVMVTINARYNGCGKSFLKHGMQRYIVMNIVKRTVQTDADIFCIQIGAKHEAADRDPELMQNALSGASRSSAPSPRACILPAIRDTLLQVICAFAFSPFLKLMFCPRS